MAFVLIAAAILFFSASVYELWKKGELDRRYDEAQKERSSQFFDSMGCWSTVSYFNQLKYEQLRYSQTVKAHLQSSIDIQIHYIVTSLGKELALDFGRTGACLLAASLIINGELGVGDMSALLAYWAQFSSKLVLCSNVLLGHYSCRSPPPPEAIKLGK